MKMSVALCAFCAILLLSGPAWAGREKSIDFDNLAELREAVSAAVGAVIREAEGDERTMALVTCHMRAGEGSRLLGVVDTNQGILIACAPALDTHLANAEALEVICSSLGFANHMVRGHTLICLQGRDS